jgi:hypothetical protein
MVKALSSAVLSWLGIVGGAITVFSSLETLFKLAEGVRWVVDRWKQWINFGWDALLSRLPFIDLTVSTRFQMTMAVAIVCMAVGARLSTPYKEYRKQKWSPGAGNVIRMNVAIAVLIFAAHAWFFGYWLAHVRHADVPSWLWEFRLLIFYGTYAAAIFIGLAHWPMFAAVTGTIGAVIFSEAFQSAAQAVRSSTRTDQPMSLVIGSGFAIVAGLLVLYLAPPKAFAYRVWHLLIGLCILIGLNELSKLGADILAPLART